MQWGEIISVKINTKQQYQSYINAAPLACSTQIGLCIYILFLCLMPKLPTSSLLPVLVLFTNQNHFFKEYIILEITLDYAKPICV
jgi:hypothetical protein